MHRDSIAKKNQSFNEIGELDVVKTTDPSSLSSPGTHRTVPSDVPLLMLFTVNSLFRPFPAGSATVSLWSMFTGNHDEVRRKKLPSNVAGKVALAGELEVCPSNCSTESTGASTKVTSVGLLDVRVFTVNLPPTWSSAVEIRVRLVARWLENRVRVSY